MLFEKKLMPDIMLGAFKELTPEMIKSLGARAVISDIDNTLAPYEAATAPEEVVKWIAALKNAGISLALVSNNGRPRVELFASGLGCLWYSRVGKPSPKYLKVAMREMGSKPEDTLFLGDQLLTDTLAAHRAGVRAIIVPPIKDKKSLFFKFKRWVEKPYMTKFNNARRADFSPGEGDKNDKT